MDKIISFARSETVDPGAAGSSLQRMRSTRSSRVSLGSRRLPRKRYLKEKESSKGSSASIRCITFIRPVSCTSITGRTCVFEYNYNWELGRIIYGQLLNRNNLALSSPDRML